VIILKCLVNTKIEIMIKTINAGVIGCRMSEEFFVTSSTNNVEKIHWKKILINDKITGGMDKKYPQSEMVKDAEEIINDTDITLVIVSDTHLGFVQPAIHAGKSVRVV